ncbi:MAG: hypothetical protein H6582_08125 [Crocinitomicaceae bacterium]|nr:hypothetical protein [Crocinitomicaceae bacterium]
MKLRLVNILNLNLVVFLIALSMSMVGSAQDTDKGQVKFLVDVDNGYFEIMIDDTMFLKLFKCDLELGKHSAKIWSPGYITNQVDFEVFKDSTTEVLVNMAISNERKQFEADYKSYRMDFHKSITIPGYTTLGLGLATTGFLIAAYDTRRQVYADIDSYNYSASYIDAVKFKSDVLANNQKYNRLRYTYYTFLGLTAASLGTTIYTSVKFKRNRKEPTFNPDSPFKTSSTLYISPFGVSWLINIG